MLDAIKGNTQVFLAFASNRAEADQAQCWFPTSAFSTFTLDGEWADLAEGDFSAVHLDNVRRRG